MKQNKDFLSIYFIKLNYFKSILLLRIFPLLMLFNILSCESSKNFNIFQVKKFQKKELKMKKF